MPDVDGFHDVWQLHQRGLLAVTELFFFKLQLTDDCIDALCELIISHQGKVDAVHLSHNGITTAGAKQLCERIAPIYPIKNVDGTTFAPLWLRLEHNKIDAPAMNLPQTLYTAKPNRLRKLRPPAPALQVPHIGLRDAPTVRQQQQRPMQVASAGDKQEADTAHPRKEPSRQEKPAPKPQSPGRKPVPRSAPDAPRESRPQQQLQQQQHQGTQQDRGQNQAPRQQGQNKAQSRPKTQQQQQQQQAADAQHNTNAQQQQQQGAAPTTNTEAVYYGDKRWYPCKVGAATERGKLCQFVGYPGWQVGRLRAAGPALMRFLFVWCYAS
jgi:hypothetical protein